MDIDLSRRSSLLMTHVGLVTLSLRPIHLPAYFSPNDWLDWPSHMPQTIQVSFAFALSSRYVEQHLLLQSPHMLCFPTFAGLSLMASALTLEALLPWIAMPHLETVLVEERNWNFQISFLQDYTFSIQYLSQFMGTIGDLRCGSAKFWFHSNTVVREVTYP